MGRDKARRVQWLSTAGLLTVVLLLIQTAGVRALGGTYLGDYGRVSSYSPNFGQRWGSNFHAWDGHYIQAEQWSMVWDQGNANNVSNEWEKFGPTFHVFSRYSGNCALPFSFDGVWETNMPMAWVYSKSATCKPYPENSGAAASAGMA